MRVLVAGGTGFIGSHIVAQLVGGGFDVRSLSRRAPVAGALSGVDYLIGNLANAANTSAGLSDVDAAVFAATTTTPGSAQRDPAVDLEMGLAAARGFLDAARAAEVGHLVLISSGGTVYGIPQTLPIDETHPTRPISAYGATKLAVEELFARTCEGSGIRLTTLRVGNAFGERQDPERDQGAPAVFLAALLAGRTVEIWGDGSVVRDYVDASDVGDAVVAALRQPRDHPFLVVNIGSGKGHSLVEVLEICGRIVGVAPQVVYKGSRAFDVPAVVLDVRRAKTELGWQATTPLEVGLAREAASLEVTVS